MDSKLSHYGAGHSIDWSPASIGDAVKSLWARLRESLAARRRRRVAAAIYGVLSKMSDAELERRGMRREDVYLLVAEMADDRRRCRRTPSHPAAWRRSKGGD